MNVGISLLAVDAAHIWNSGMNQNIAFLVMLLRKMPNVEKIYLLNGGDVDVLPTGMAQALDGVAMVRPHEVTYDIDVVIEMGAQLPVEWLRHVRALGAKLVLFLVGHPYAAAAEGPIFGKGVGITFNASPWHEVWLLPQYAKTSLSMLRTVTRVPVVEMPHIWSPFYLELQIAQVRERGLRFGFEPGPAGWMGQAARPWRAAIFEPNLSVAKTSVIAMLACEAAYRREAACLETMMVLNTFHMKEHRTFNAFAMQLDLTRDHKASYEPRLGFAECMSEHRMDAVVSHHWENGQNYLYYDALHGGYPLVHNSDYLKRADVGFHYPGFAASEGGNALLRAWHQDAGYWQDYSHRASRFLRTLAPDRAQNVQAFAKRLRPAGREAA